MIPENAASAFNGCSQHIVLSYSPGGIVYPDQNIAEMVTIDIDRLSEYLVGNPDVREMPYVVGSVLIISFIRLKMIKGTFDYRSFFWVDNNLEYWAFNKYGQSVNLPTFDSDLNETMLIAIMDKFKDVKDED